MAADGRLSVAAPDRYRRALERIDAAHAGDPERDAAGEAAELVYARRMSAWLERLAPEASEALRLAARCQHLRRWEIRRGDYPAGAAGYRKWRADEAAAHAVAAKEILEAAGYEPGVIAAVQALVKKEDLKRNAETRTLEDASCLVFLESYFGAFAAKHDEPTLVRILKKTWAKMSPQGREAALALELAKPLRALLEKAIDRA